MLAVKEMFYTLQGEGAQAGRAAVFCRFAGCNLWSGREQDREAAQCKFCDTEFVGTDGDGGGRFETPDLLAIAALELWPKVATGAKGKPFLVCTGGEPLLQLNLRAVAALRQYGFTVAVETNGTIEPPSNIDWLCVSPKAGAELRVRRGDELKVVFPQPGLVMDELERLDFQHHFVQPMAGPHLNEFTRAAVEFCLSRPRWRLSLQTHKLLGIR